MPEASETSQLLPTSSAATGHSLLSKERSCHILQEELKEMVQLAIPVIGAYFFEWLPGIVSLVLVGHIAASSESTNNNNNNETTTKAYIDATALASMFINITGLSIGIGMATAMDTLCSQAYGAWAKQNNNKTNKNKNSSNDLAKVMSIYFQTGLIVMAIVFVPIFFINFYCTEILTALKQPTNVAMLAGQFARWMLPGLPFLFVYELMKKVLQAQNIVQPQFLVSIVSNVINVTVSYYLIYHTNMGFLGAALGRTIANMSFPLLLLPYIYYNKDTTGLASTFWNDLYAKEAIKGIQQFFVLGIPGMFMVCFGWWAFELMALLSGLLPNAIVAIGSNAVLFNIASTTYMFYLGISVSGNVRVGNALGGNDPNRAQIVSVIAIALSASVAVIIATILVAFRRQIPMLFTNDIAINKLTTSLILCCAGYQITDAVNAGVQGSFRGSGRQMIGAILSFSGYYCVGIPLGILFAFTFSYGLLGLWIGISCGLLVVCILGLTIIYRTDWKQLADEAVQRSKQVTRNDETSS